MGEVKRRHDALLAYRALPLYLQQGPLPALLCACLRPGWDVQSAMDALEHVYCQEPYWLTLDGQIRMRDGWWPGR